MWNSLMGQFLLVFRETLEAALITTVTLTYLIRTGRKQLTRHVWYGVGFASVASFSSGAFVWLLYGGFSGLVKALFEGVAALLAVFVLSSMIYWMATKGRRIKMEIEEQVEDLAERGAAYALTSFSFVVVFREGLETVLFLAPFLVTDFGGTFIGTLVGFVASLVFSWAVFILGVKINMQRFFLFTSLLLVLLAGGLAGYGVHELLEYSDGIGVEVGWLAEKAYVLDVPEDSPFHHKGFVGSVLAVMFGYTVAPEWGRLVVHFTYLILTLPLVTSVYRKRNA